MFSPSSHVFSEIFLHINWHCENDQPLILTDLEGDVHKIIREYCQPTRGVLFHGVGGTEDHIHLVLQIEPIVNISDLVGRIKGASSFAVNKQYGKGAIGWQRGYGVVSFARRDLKGVLKYVANQKQHHAGGTANRTLEKFGDVDDGYVQEDVDNYGSSGLPW